MWEKAMVPGPTKLIGGNSQAGFYGEVPASDFITGDELARRVGLTAGKSQYSDEPWLKFSYLGKVEFVAKKPFRHSISWDAINTVGAVFGNKRININGKIYKVRLMKGKTEGKQDDQSAYKGTICHNSEWNKLMLPIHKNAPSSWAYKDNVSSPTENWNIGYTDADLLTHYKFGTGAFSWCQEYSTVYRFGRGCYGVSYSSGYASDVSITSVSWRPVLELVD
ncbi:hypothetical protein [Peptoniphilus duerdenii]|uniref:hypothetical protein n=1 Tax=Peptoniphilus duerdenii TaxID=507750 RepID=UPI0023F2BD01|nr:hypothetical protein [Peptoniphilus duerdenii]